MPRGFRPPKPNAFTLAIGRLATVPALRWIYGIVAIDYDRADIQRFAAIARDRVLITPNHPTNAEPVVLFHLSRVVKRRFYFVSNRESFDRVFGLFGKLLQGCGAYSIIRGAPDRESFKFTRKLLAEHRAKLVIFPEGEVYSQNDSLLPFHDGVYQLAMSAAEDLRKLGDAAPLWVQPVAVKYHYVGNAKREIERSISRLEVALNLRPTEPSPIYERLLGCARKLLASAESAYHLEVPQDATLQNRIDGVREAIVERVSQSLGMEVEPRDHPLPDRMRSLYNAVFAVVQGDVEVESVYDARLAQEERKRVQPMLDDLRRLANWVAVQDTYIATHPTPERFIDTLRRMEYEVLGGVKIKAKKRCLVRLAEPFDIREYGPAYVQDRKGTVAAICGRAEQSVQVLLQSPVPERC